VGRYADGLKAVLALMFADRMVADIGELELSRREARSGSRHERV
jgi:hypothetical protein